VHIIPSHISTKLVVSAQTTREVRSTYSQMKFATIPQVPSAAVVRIPLMIACIRIRLTTQTLGHVSMSDEHRSYVAWAYNEPVMSSKATPILRLVGSRRSLMMNSGKTKSVRSVAALIHAVARKNALRLMQ